MFFRGKFHNIAKPKNMGNFISSVQCILTVMFWHNDEIGIGYAYSHYDRFECEGCGQKVEEGKHHNYFGPTKAAISLVYLF